MSLDLSGVDFNEISYEEQSNVSKFGVNPNTGAPFSQPKGRVVKARTLADLPSKERKIFLALHMQVAVDAGKSREEACQIRAEDITYRSTWEDGVKEQDEPDLYCYE